MTPRLNLALPVALGVALCLSGCSSGGGSQMPRGSRNSQTMAHVSFQVRWHASNTMNGATKRKPRDLSPGAQSIVVQVNPQQPGQAGQVFNCCANFWIDAPVGTDTFVFRAYDQPNGQGALLGQANVSQQIIADQFNTVSVTIDGICATLGVWPIQGQASFEETSPNGPLITLPGGSNQPFSTTAYDADGYHIIGPGSSPPVSTASATNGAGVSTLPNSPLLEVNLPHAIGQTYTQSTLTVASGACTNPAVLHLAFVPQPQGQISTLASGFKVPDGVAVDSKGTVYVANNSSGVLNKVSKTGGVTVLASGFNKPVGVAVDSQGTVYVANNGNGTLDEVSPTGVVTQTVALPSSPYGLAVDTAGTSYVAIEAGSGLLDTVTQAGLIKTLAQSLNDPTGVAVDVNGVSYVADYVNGNLYEINQQGTVTTLATGFKQPVGVAVDASGTIYVVNSGTGVVNSVSQTGTVATVASGLVNPGFDAVDINGTLYVGRYDTNSLVTIK